MSGVRAVCYLALQYILHCLYISVFAYCATYCNCSKILAFHHFMFVAVFSVHIPSYVYHLQDNMNFSKTNFYRLIRRQPHTHTISYTISSICREDLLRSQHDIHTRPRIPMFVNIYFYRCRHFSALYYWNRITSSNA